MAEETRSLEVSQCFAMLKQSFAKGNVGLAHPCLTLADLCDTKIRKALSNGISLKKHPAGLPTFLIYFLIKLLNHFGAHTCRCESAVVEEVLHGNVASEVGEHSNTIVCACQCISVSERTHHF